MTKIALTGQQVHAAYTRVQMEQLAALHLTFISSTVREWDDLTQQDRERYERMASFLNDVIAEMEART